MALHRLLIKNLTKAFGREEEKTVPCPRGRKNKTLYILNPTKCTCTDVSEILLTMGPDSIMFADHVLNWGTRRLMIRSIVHLICSFRPVKI